MDFREILVTTAAGFGQAAWITVQLTFLSLLLGSVLGLILAFLKISSIRVLQWGANLYIALIRGTPLIVQIMFFYFGLAQGLGWNINEFPAGILALGIHASAYIAEIFRGAIQSIDRGQMEAARSLGMSYTQAMRRIIMPQAFRRSLPPLGNQFIIGLKDSSLVAYIGVNELFGVALSEASANYQPFLTYAVNGLYYLALVLIFTFLLNRMEGHLHGDKGGTG